MGSSFAKLWESSTAVQTTLRGLSDAEFQQRYQAIAWPDDVRSLEEVMRQPSALAMAIEAVRRSTGRAMEFDEVEVGLGLCASGVFLEVDSHTKLRASSILAFACLVQGRHMHVVTVDEVQSTTWAEGLQQSLSILGLRAMPLLRGATADRRRTSYRATVVVGTGFEFTSDYAGDTFLPAEERLQSRHDIALILESDVTLYDEAVPPVVLVSALGVPNGEELRMRQLAQTLRLSFHYHVQSSTGEISLTVEGANRASSELQLSDISHQNNRATLLALEDALRAKDWFKRGEDYDVRDNQIVLINEHVSRLKRTHRFQSDMGVRQSLEVKEGLEITPEARVAVAIDQATFIRSYAHLAGFAGNGTRFTVEAVLGSEVWRTPAKRRLAKTRRDRADRLLPNDDSRIRAVLKAVIRSHQRGFSVVIGNATPAEAEVLAAQLRDRGIVEVSMVHGADPKAAAALSSVGCKGAVTVIVGTCARNFDVTVTEEGAWLAFSQQDFALASAPTAPTSLAVYGMRRDAWRRKDCRLRDLAGRRGIVGTTQFFLARTDPLVSGKKIYRWLPAGIRRRGIMLHQYMGEDAIRERDTAVFTIENKPSQQFVKLRNHYDATAKDELVRPAILGWINRAALVVAEQAESVEQVADSLRLLYRARLTTWDLSAGDSLPIQEKRQAVCRLVVQDMLQVYNEREGDASSEVLRYHERHVVLTCLSAEFGQLVKLEESYAERDRDRRSPSKAFMMSYSAFCQQQYERTLDRVALEVVRGVLSHRP